MSLESQSSDEIPVPDDLPAPRVKRKHFMPRLVWIVPTVAALLGLTLIFKSWRARGPEIKISFISAEGIEVEKTLVKARNVPIGRVTDITLSEDRKNVIVTAALTRQGASVAKEDSIFWVVRPRVGIGGATGLDTLLTGSFIGVKLGSSSKDQTSFRGLENPPPLTHGGDGKSVELHAASAGSIAISSPVYFRQFQVGRVADLNLMSDGTTRIELFIDAPNDKFVNPRTRFWNSSGIEMKVGGDGFKVKTESIAAVIGGGISFDDGPAGAPSGASLFLFKDQEQAMAPASGEPHFLSMRFADAVKGLAVDAPVEFRGVNIGSVVSIDLGYESRDQSFPVLIVAKIFPQRMGSAFKTMVRIGAVDSEAAVANFVGSLVAHGLRAQARSSSLLAGSLYVALDFFPRTERVAFAIDARPLEMPTIRSSSNEIENRITHIAKTLDELPLREVAADLDGSLKSVHATFEQLQHQLLPTATSALNSADKTLSTIDAVLADRSPLREELNATLYEAQSALRSVRDLADLLNRQPEALIKGRREAKTPSAPAAVASPDKAR